jgi:antitoxin component of MazEF toxin-antitoxin module
MRQLFMKPSHTARIAKKVNKLTQKYEIRRPHFEGKKEASCSLIVPAKFVDCIGLVKGDYVKLYVDNNKIWMERMANQIEGSNLKQVVYRQKKKEEQQK